jgi:hypothetical protein
MSSERGVTVLRRPITKCKDVKEEGTFSFRHYAAVSVAAAAFSYCRNIECNTRKHVTTAHDIT